MTDKSLLEDLELFQELPEPEVEAVAGSTSAVTTAKSVDNLALRTGLTLGNIGGLGGCPACLSGLDPTVFKFQDVIQPV